MSAQVAQSRLIQVLYNPAAHHAVEANHDETAHDADIGEQVVFLTRREALEGRLHIAVGRASDNELAQNHRDSHHQDAENIDQDESATAILTCLVGETPDVSQTYSGAHCRSNGAQTCSKTGSFTHKCIEVLLDFLQK